MNPLIRDSLRTGAVATFATTVAAATFGEAENDSALAPLNAVSHIAWGDEAASHDEPSLKYTATGLALNAAAVTSWAGVFEFLFGDAADRGDVAGALLGGAIVSALAYATDYHVVPARFTPGFEKRLSNRALLGIYTTLALGLAVGGLCRPTTESSDVNESFHGRYQNNSSIGVP